jgi:2-methylcitrate dehydratase PrpD
MSVAQISGAAAPGRAQAFGRAMIELPVATDDLARLTDLLLDHLAVGLSGGRYPWVRAVQQWSRSYAGTGQSPVLGAPWTTAPEVSALVNGMAGHSFELDDTHEPSMSHPGAVIFPAVLSLGAAGAVTGAEILAAAASGYETMARLGRAAGAAEVIARGWHPTSLFGVFGAAAAASRLLRLGPEVLVRAWGHCLSLAGGSMQFSQEADGADVKRLHAGIAARNGIFAVEMARAGVGAPEAVFDGRYGVFQLFGEADRGALTAGAGRLALHQVSLKPYACNRLLHAVIDALGEITAFRVPLTEVRGVVVRGPRKLVDQHNIRRPRSVMAAQYSLPFTVGAAMVFGPLALEAYDPVNLERPEVLGWADLVRIEADPALEACFPEHFGAEVEIAFADGRTQRARVLDSLGAPGRPMSRADIAGKARRLTQGVLSAAPYARLEAAVLEIAAEPSAGPLCGALIRSGDPRWS